MHKQIPSLMYHETGLYNIYLTLQNPDMKIVPNSQCNGIYLKE